MRQNDFTLIATMNRINTCHLDINNRFFPFTFFFNFILTILNLNFLINSSVFIKHRQFPNHGYWRYVVHSQVYRRTVSLQALPSISQIYENMYIPARDSRMLTGRGPTIDCRLNPRRRSSRRRLTRHRNAGKHDIPAPLAWKTPGHPRRARSADPRDNPVTEDRIIASNRSNKFARRRTYDSAQFSQFSSLFVRTNLIN